MDKKLLSLALIIFCALSSAQNVYTLPISTHFDTPYTVTLHGTGTLYYTTDGTTPTLGSQTAVNIANIYIDQNKEIKAFVVGAGGTSPIYTKKYYTGTLPATAIYFKPPANWNNSCVMVYMENPNSINGAVIDPILPGQFLQSTGCQGWYKTAQNLPYENAYITFNNCPYFPQDPNGQYSNTLFVGSVVLYDYSAGVITNAPPCLNLSTAEAQQEVTVIKVYPNPVTELLEVASAVSFDTYSVLDSSGKLISGPQKYRSKINVSDLPTGMYFLKLDGKESVNRTVIRFIKK